MLAIGNYVCITSGYVDSVPASVFERVFGSVQEIRGVPKHPGIWKPSRRDFDSKLQRILG